MRQHKKPCKACPFRRTAPAGWLGEAMPETFVAALLITEEPLPCHKKIDYSDPDWSADFAADTTGRLCAGALIAGANQCKLPRNRTRPRLPADHTAVFSNAREFVEHHRAGLGGLGVGSWDEEPALRDELRRHLGLGPLEKKR